MVLTSLKQVFGNIRYLAVAVITGFAAFVLSVWLPNLKLVGQVITSSTATLLDKYSILIGLLGSIKTNFSVFSGSYTIAIAVLFGANVAMVIYYFKQRKSFLQKNGMALSFGGLVSGMFGIGCAACGTLVLGPLLSMIGAGGIIALLPFGGQGFGVLGVGVLSFSIFSTAKKIQDPLVCKVDSPE
ncbi:MAG: hypothetical protein KJI71_00875 [Patescibacteria group bacterium]|nr:hypothetical protein [Patescibacteria group bacterium]